MKLILKLLTVLLFVPLTALTAADFPKPNIVLIMADDQGWGDTGYNGHIELKTWLDWPNKLHTDPVTTRYNKSKQDGDLAAALLYDISKDPKETSDLAAQDPERVAKMTAALQAWKASVENSLTGADYRGQLIDIGPDH